MSPLDLNRTATSCNGRIAKNQVVQGTGGLVVLCFERSSSMKTRRIALFIVFPHACYGSQRVERRLVGPLPALSTTNVGGGVAARIGAESGVQLAGKSSGLGFKSSRSNEAADNIIQAARSASDTDARLLRDVTVGESLLLYEPLAPCKRCLKKDKDTAGKGDDIEAGGLGAGDEDGSSDGNGEDSTDDSDGENEDVDCAHASTCDDCAAVPLQDDNIMCWWNGTLCQEEESLDAERDVDTMCRDAGVQTEAPTPAKDAGEIADEPRVEENATPSMAPTPGKSDGSSATSSPTPRPVERETPAPTVKTSAPTAKTTTPAPVAKIETKAPTSPPVRPNSEEEGVDDDSSFGGTTAMLIGVILLVGVVVCLRRRAAPVGAIRGAGGGGGFGSLPSQPSYQGVYVAACRFRTISRPVSPRI
jgi:hypothetical protein